MKKAKKAKMKEYDLIIVGGGAAGMSAGLYAVRQGLSTLMIAREMGGQLSLINNIENYLGFMKASGAELISKFTEQFNNYKIPVEMEEVTDIEIKGKKFLVRTMSKEFIAKTVLITTGRISRKLNVPGENRFYGRGISSCTICDAAFFKGKTVAVIGTGDSALHAVLHLSSFAKKIFLLTKYPKLKGEKIRQEKVLELAKAKKVEIIYETKVTEVHGETSLEGIKFEHKGKTIDLPLNGIFIEIGMNPETDIIDFLKKTEKNEIIINMKNETSVPGIFAAGDCTDIPDKQLIIAAGEGAKAALSAARYIEMND